MIQVYYVERDAIGTGFLLGPLLLALNSRLVIPTGIKILCDR